MTLELNDRAWEVVSAPVHLSVCTMGGVVVSKERQAQVRWLEVMLRKECGLIPELLFPERTSVLMPRDLGWFSHREE